MRRRAALGLIGGAVLSPARGRAQDSGRNHRLGVISISPRDTPNWTIFFDELRQASFVEGRNLIVDAGGFALSDTQMTAHAQELSRAGETDFIVCIGPVAVRAAQAATRTIPVAALSDFTASSFGTSLARPNANLTGVSILADELNLKRQELLMDLLPRATRMAALVERGSQGLSQVPVLVAAARARGVALTIHEVSTSSEIAAAVDAAAMAGAEGLNVLASSRVHASRATIIARAAAARLPAIYEWPETAEEGGLIGYGARVTTLFRQLATVLVRLLRGARPGDVPIEQVTRIALVINRRTAAAIGVAIPPTLLALADDVIE